MKRLSVRTLRSIGVILLSVVLTAIITQPAGAGARLQSGEAANTTYKSPRTVTYKSDLKTREAETRAADQVPAVYRADLTAASQQDGKVSATLAAVTTLRADPGPLEQRLPRLQQVLPNLSADEARGVLELPPDAWNQVQAALRDAMTRLQATQVRQDDLAKSEELVAGQVPRTLPPTVRQNTVLIGKKLLIPNFVIDEEATTAAKDRAETAVEPISYTIERDQVIVSRGQVVNEFDLERLTAAGLTRPNFEWQGSLGIFLLVLLFAILLLEVAPRFSQRLAYPRRTLALLAGLAVGLTLAGVLVVPNQPILAYVLPVAAPAMLLAIFYGFTFGSIAGAAFTAFFALASGGSFELFFIHLAAAIIGVLVARRITDTVAFLRAGALVAGVVFVGMAAFALLTPNFDPNNLPKFFLAAALNGALTATFVFAGAAFLGNPLGIVTFLQLLELENPRQPLLKRLAEEAPGTYSHSLRMAGIVESVAERVGADPLLARVLALYHDIGKTSVPEYFVENQRGANPHDELGPKESADILRSHISEGLSLAHGAGLPEQVAAGIPEHHGTSLMGYFWEAAKRRYKRPVESDYRYIGPKPQSKETAILMLADSMEAASRLLNDPDEQAIRDLVKQLITGKIADGQLDDAPLSTKELNVIREAFAESLINDLHKRISYPAERRAGT